MGVIKICHLQCYTYSIKVKFWQCYKSQTEYFGTAFQRYVANCIKWGIQYFKEYFESFYRVFLKKLPIDPWERNF